VVSVCNSLGQVIHTSLPSVSAVKTDDAVEMCVSYFQIV